MKSHKNVTTHTVIKRSAQGWLVMSCDIKVSICKEVRTVDLDFILLYEEE